MDGQCLTLAFKYAGSKLLKTCICLISCIKTEIASQHSESTPISIAKKSHNQRSFNSYGWFNELNFMYVLTFITGLTCNCLRIQCICTINMVCILPIPVWLCQINKSLIIVTHSRKNCFTYSRMSIKPCYGWMNSWCSTQSAAQKGLDKDVWLKTFPIYIPLRPSALKW